jgi:hypothetical protein
MTRRPIASEPPERAAGAAHPAVPAALGPAPEAASAVPAAACGEGSVNRPGLARTAPAADGDGRRGMPSRVAARGGTAGAGNRSPAPAPTSAQEGSAPPDPAIARRASRGQPPASARSAPAAYPNSGGRGATSSLPERGGSGGARDGGSGGEVQAAGPPPAIGPGGGARTTAAPSPGFSGQEFRDRYKAALSAGAADRRRGRTRRPDPAASPAAGRIRLASRPPERFGDAPPPDLRLRPPEPPDEAAL